MEIGENSSEESIWRYLASLKCVVPLLYSEWEYIYINIWTLIGGPTACEVDLWLDDEGLRQKSLGQILWLDNKGLQDGFCGLTMKLYDKYLRSEFCGSSTKVFREDLSFGALGVFFDWMSFLPYESDDITTMIRENDDITTLLFNFIQYQTINHCIVFYVWFTLYKNKLMYSFFKWIHLLRTFLGNSFNFLNCLHFL